MPRRPSTGNITSPYGWRDKHPITRQRSFHYGEDIGWANGTKLVSPINGVITDYSHSPGWGNLVTIRNDTTRIRLAHTARLAPHIRVDDAVFEGRYLAVMGSSGRSTGVHVHWEVELNGVTINPVEWLHSFATQNKPIVLTEKVVKELAKEIKYYASTNPRTNLIEYGIFGMKYPGGYEVTNNIDTGVVWGKLFGRESGDVWDILPWSVFLRLQSESRVLNQRYITQGKMIAGTPE